MDVSQQQKINEVIECESIHIRFEMMNKLIRNHHKWKPWNVACKLNLKNKIDLMGLWQKYHTMIQLDQWKEVKIIWYVTEN